MMSDVTTRRPLAELVRERILELWRQSGLSQSELCRRSGLDATAITNLKQGITPTLGRIEAYAKGLRVDPSYLLREEAEPASEMSQRELDLLYFFRQLPDEDQIELLAEARGMARARQRGK